MNVTCGRCGTVNSSEVRCRECSEYLHQFRTPKVQRSQFPLVLALVLTPGIILAGLIILFLAAFKSYYIPSGAMEPTLRIHDILFANRLAYVFSPPKDGDIVVFDPPIATTNPFIKRVMGSPGENFRIHGGIAYRNGVALAEPYIAEKTNYELEIKNYNIYVDGTPLDPSQANIPPKSSWTSPDTVPPNCYFMMGDNRNNSEDSHIWGFAQSDERFYSGPQAGKASDTFLQAIWIISPAERMRSII